MADLLLAYQSLFAFVGINGLLALSVYTTLSCGQLSLANAGFMAIGAYTSALITLRASGVPFIAALAASALLPAIVAVPLGLPVLRLRGVFLAIATVGFGEVVRLFFVNWDYTNGAMGLVAIPQRTQLWTIALALALALFILGRLRGSRAGYALEAIREDETAARTMGIYTTGHKLAMLALGAALAGLAGGLEAHFTFMVAPGGYAFGRVVEMLVQAVVGGTAAFYGPVVGAAFLRLLRPTGGKIELDGRRIDGLPPNRVAALGVARTYQNIRLFGGLSAADNVVVGQHLRRNAPVWRRLLLLPSARNEERAAREAAEAGLARVGMRERALTRAFNLSYGEQRRVEIARALAAQPRLVLLDEPTAGMNPNEAAAVARLVREVANEGRAVLLIEHNVRLVMELCDRVTVLNFGKVIARGTPVEIGKDPAVIAAYLGESQ